MFRSTWFPFTTVLVYESQSSRLLTGKMAGKKRSLRGGGNILDLLSGRKKTAGSTSAAPLEVDGDPVSTLTSYTRTTATTPLIV